MTTPHTHPVLAGGYGRLTTLWDVDVVPSLAPAGPAEDASADAILTTGGTWRSPINGTRIEAARYNGRTIGSATSGAIPGGYIRSNRFAFPLAIFALSSSHSGAVSSQRGPGALASNG